SPPNPTPNNPSVTNMAIFPDYSVNPPSVVGTPVGTAGSNPSAVDIDTTLGILAVAETGSNQVEFFSISKGSLASVGTQSVPSPTGLSINQTNHTVAVVDYQDQSVVVFPLPGQTGDPLVTYPLTISLAGLVPPNAIVGPLPMPYSIGVDSDTNNAIVAYSSTANPTTAKVGFLLDLNKNANQTCIATSGGSPCVHAQVTLNTGPFPQIAMLPHSHTAYVTPGGVGVVSGVDVTRASFSTPISSVSLTSGLVTVITSSAHNLTPGSPTTVLISGVTDSDFNGAFTVQSVINSTSFTYALNVSTNKQSTGGTVFYSSPNVLVPLSPTSRGIAINPITRTAAIADANATNGAQINLLNSLDQSVSTINFLAGCTAFTTSCSGAPEFLGTTSVAFQPYSNLLVSYNSNPALSANQKDQVSISNPVTLQRYAFVSDSSGDATHLGGTGSASISVGSNTLNLFGGLAVDPATNQAFVVQSGSNTIRIVDLGGLKAAQITELQVQTVPGAQIGGIPGALMSQGTLSSSADLQHVKIYGSGFDASTKARLDGTVVPTTFVSSRILDVTIPASPFLAMPHRFAVDVLTGAGVQSNATDFFVIKAVDLTAACSGGNPQPGSVAIADQLPGQGFAPIAVVTNTGCNNVSVVDINPASPTFGQSVGNPIATGTGPQGIAVSPRFGLAVVANNTGGTASILDIASRTQKVGEVTVGSTPTGVAINEGTGAALVANTGSNTVSQIDLSLLFPASGTAPTTLSAITISVDTSPIAIAIDPDRGTNSQGLAVVTALELISGSLPTGVLDAIDIGGATPAKSTSAVTGSVSSAPTGIVFDPSVSPALFYANSSGANTVTSYNPDTGLTSSVKVGINPTSLAMNPQTGGIMTINSTSQTVSIVDTLSNPFKTRRTFGLSGSAQFGIAIDQFTNMAVIADQAHNRLLIFPMPN
ncbi:MAG TPA: YncE family protein, partial [Candidatus Acidoferrum sp.]|nr:YncE family protein [Candidatus Acidoferrum sp.]